MRTRFSLKPLALLMFAALLQPHDAFADSLGKQWWVRDAQDQLAKEKAQQAQSDETVVVPGYFAEQPKPFERPTEIILPKTPSYGGLLSSPFAGYRTPFVGGPFSAGVSPYTPAVPYIGSGMPYIPSIAPSIPFVGSPVPYVGVPSIPYIGSSVLSAVPYRGFGGFGLGVGGLGLGGFSVGVPGIGVGVPYAGFGAVPYTPFAGSFGPYGGYGGWNPAGSALFMGAMGNRLNNSKLGQVGTSRVIQTAPSKASGNYYAPSNVDTTAAGSYYSTTSPAIIPYMKPKKAPDSYWGSGSSPFKDVNLNSTPWSK